MAQSSHGNLAIDPDRLWRNIHETAAIGPTPKGGLCRLALTESDRVVREWFRERSEALGCTVTIDETGSMFARRAGRHPQLAPVAIGSHLDTQPTGGRFDGVLGVLAGLEVLRTLCETVIEVPIEVINWTNGEGSRFAPAMLSSAVFGGAFPRDWAFARADRSGERFDAALDEIGFRGQEPCGTHPLLAHLEMNIEQGPVLEDEGKFIGIVTGVQSVRWFEITVRGLEGHAGAIPSRLRSDALLAARMVQSIAAIAAAAGPEAVGTVGLLECQPNSRNVVPGMVFLTVDLRHPRSDGLDARSAAMHDALLQDADGLSLEVEQSWDNPAVESHPECVQAVRLVVERRGFGAREVISRAGHDCLYIAQIAPTGMIFIPCVGGSSHNEAESITKDDVAAGATVLLDAGLMLDRELASGHTQCMPTAGRDKVVVSSDRPRSGQEGSRGGSAPDLVLQALAWRSSRPGSPTYRSRWAGRAVLRLAPAQMLRLIGEYSCK